MTEDVDCCADKPAVTPDQGSQTSPNRVRAWIMTPRGLTASGIAVLAIGLALNWSWLVAAGAAPIILSLAPCVVMCALGLCMGMENRSDARGAKLGQGSATIVPPRSSTQVEGLPS